MRSRDLFARDGRLPLGIRISDVDAASATGGVRVDEDGPAARAGLQAGDVVVEYDGERVRSARQFTRLVQETPDGRACGNSIARAAR